MLRRRKKFLEDYSCVLCQDNAEETLEHLFFDCSCAAARCFALGIVLNDEAPIHENSLARNNFPYPFFMEIFMVVAWCLWNERNALVFNGKAPSLSSWKLVFQREIEVHLFRIKPVLHHSISAVAQQLVIFLFFLFCLSVAFSLFCCFGLR